MSRSTLSGRGTVINDGSPKVVGKGRKGRLLKIMATIRQRAPIMAGTGTVTASLADTVAPTVPTNPAVAVVSSSALTVSWTASSDTSGVVQSGVAGYRVYRATSAGGTYSLISGASLVTGTSYPDTGLSASTPYWYKVAAVDAAGNASAQSSAASGTTLTNFGWISTDAQALGTIYQGASTSLATYANTAGGTPVYLLVNPITGLSVNPTTGLLSVAADAPAGTYSSIVVSLSNNGVGAVNKTFSATVQALVVPTGSFQITGSGFGATRAPGISRLTPMFYRFFEPGSIANGVSVESYGYYTGLVSGAPDVYMDTTQGFVPGSGCMKHETRLGMVDSFVHLYPIIPGLSELEIFQAFYWKFEQTAGTSSTEAVQIKGSRFCYQTEYHGRPAIHNNYWPSKDGSFDGGGAAIFVGAFDTTERGQKTFDASPPITAFKSRWRRNDWNLAEMWARFNDVGAYNGFNRTYCNGSWIGLIRSTTFGTAEAMGLIRTAEAQRINYVSLFPGIDNPGDTSRSWRVRFAEHVVDNTCARVVVGNAATWDACTHRQYMIPTTWTDNTVVAQWRALGFASSGQTVYGYVVNAAGTVSPATTLVVP